LCGDIPAGAIDIFWQLTTVAGGDKPSSRVRVSEALVGVAYS
jgi:hypothetical protein